MIHYVCVRVRVCVRARVCACDRIWEKDQFCCNMEFAMQAVKKFYKIYYQLYTFPIVYNFGLECQIFKLDKQNRKMNFASKLTLFSYSVTMLQYISTCVEIFNLGF